MRFEWGKIIFLCLPSRLDFARTQKPLKPLFFNDLFHKIALYFMPLHYKIKKKKTPPSLDGGVVQYCNVY